MSPAYEHWLLAYALHFVVQACASGVSPTVATVLALLREEGVLTVDPSADWLALLRTRAPCLHPDDAGGHFVLFPGVRASDFPHPGPPPEET